jgi:hypothetical protein
MINTEKTITCSFHTGKKKHSIKTINQILWDGYYQQIRNRILNTHILEKILQGMPMFCQEVPNFVKFAT